MNNKVNIRKRLIILGICLLIVLGAVFGSVSYAQYRMDQKTVEVLPMNYVSSSGWGGSSSTSGSVVSDYVQELYPDSQKTISEIFVTEGQEVTIGTPLLQYDKTSLELAVEAREIDVKKVEVEIDEAQRKLKKYQNTKPYSTPRPTVRPSATRRPTATPTPRPTARPTSSPRPTATPSPTPVPTPVPTPDVNVYSELDLDSVPYKGCGTTEDPYIFLCTENFEMTPAFLKHLFGLYSTVDPTPDPTQEPGSEPEPSSDLDSSSEEVISSQSDGEDSGGTEGEDPGPSIPETDLVTPVAAVFEIREGNSNYGELVSSFSLDGTKLSALFSLPGLVTGAESARQVAQEVKMAAPAPRRAS